MITPLQSLALGIVQGLAEFLPISSSAHLILLPAWAHWPDPGLAFDVALHLGTLLGVVVYYWKELSQLVESVIRPSDPALGDERHLVALLAIATVPGAIAGVLLEHRAETIFRSPALVAWDLMALGLALGIADYLTKGRKDIYEMTWPMALLIGCAQGLAIIPGISRSGITITVALALGLKRPEAARFSFLMSVPIIAGAGILKFKEILMSPQPGVLSLGFVGAAISGLFAIWLLLKYVQTHRYTPFVVYRFLLGAFVLLNLSKF